MVKKTKEKKLAIKLRRQGKTYNEILKVVPVAKSTLSLWLREVGLSKAQKQTITEKRRAAQLRGGARRREIRLTETDQINLLCKNDIQTISDHELFLIGVTLYWAEGAKKSGDRSGCLIDFGNSDPAIIKIFIRWLKKIFQTKNEDIVLRLHLHEGHKHRETEIKYIWSRELCMPVTNFGRTIYKKHNPKTVRKKTDNSYIGLVSVRVKKSTRINRRILGWIYAIIATQK